MIRNSTLKRYKPLPRQTTPIARKTALKKTSTPIKRQTKKESSVKKQLSLLKKEIELEAVQNNQYFCAGCGCSYPGLDKSHILSVGQYKHLELLKENIQLLCRTCHRKWESGNIELMMELNCFIANLKFIALHDDVAYNKLLTKASSYNQNFELNHNRD